VLLQGGAGLLLCTWFPAAREEGHKKENRREEKKEKKRKEEGKNEREKRKEFFPNLEISEKIKDTLQSWSKKIFVEER
jgi:hypothetical protein